MPCNSARTYTANFERADQAILDVAAKAIGLKKMSNNHYQTPEGYSIVLSGKEARCPDAAREYVAKLKVRQSVEVVKAQAKRLGWQLDRTSENKFIAKRGA